MPTSDWLTRSSDHFCHWGHLSLSSKVVSLDVQQHCSWLYQNADKQTPSFRSVIQSTARSITPANVPGREEKRNGSNRKYTIKGNGRHLNKWDWITAIQNMSSQKHPAKMGQSLNKEHVILCWVIQRWPKNISCFSLKASAVCLCMQSSHSCRRRACALSWIHVSRLVGKEKIGSVLSYLLVFFTV